jgi:hypothetical protein
MGRAWQDLAQQAAVPDSRGGSEMASQHGLDGRTRDENGRIRAKNGATRVDTLRDLYGDDFAAGSRGDMKLDTLLDRSGCDSLSAYRKRSSK